MSSDSLNMWIGDPEIKDIRTTKEESATRLSKLQQTLPGLLGYGITKNSPENISVICEELTPEIESMFRAGIRGQPVRLIEVGHIVALSDQTMKYRPLIGGISIGHHLISAGTLGAIVYDKNTNQPLLLSNAHVLANSDTQTADLAFVGDDVLQPGRIDDPYADAVATLHDWIPLEDNVTVDAAVASPMMPVSNIILNIQRITGTISPETGMHVRKMGRTTRLSEGEIISVETSITVDYGTESIILTDQFITTAMSAGGDSGSIGINEDGKVVGLLFAGSSKATVYNDINNVIELLNIKFVPYDTGEEGEHMTINETTLTQQDITVIIGVLGLYISWKRSRDLTNVLKELHAHIPPLTGAM